MVNCLKGCVRQYLKKGIRKPLDSDMFMPWVEVQIDGAERTIGVGNYSSKKNRAVVKSFQFGVSNGLGASVEIIDEDGSNYIDFFEKISMGNQESADKYSMHFQFGWATADCGGSVATRGPFTCCAFETARMSCRHTLGITNIKTDIQNGLYKFTVSGVDLVRDVSTTRPKTNYGTDSNPMRLRPAIETLCLEKLNLKVQFRRITAACQEEEFQFRNVGDIDRINGPVGRWETKGRNIIQCAKDWLSNYVSGRNKGIITFFRSVRGTPTLVFMESNIINCESSRNSDPLHIGTYIIGGDCSPVISFSPSVDINYTVMESLHRRTSGVSGGALSPASFVQDGPELCLKDLMPNSNEQGAETTMIESDNSYRIFGTSATLLAGRNRFINKHANSFLAGNAIEAELRIQGDPALTDPILMNGHFVSIVHLNPFVVANQGSTCDWLSNGCNRYLSNTEWRIQGVSHEIKEGSYTTTLKLRLSTPGVDTARSSPLGGMPGAPTIP